MSSIVLFRRLDRNVYQPPELSIIKKYFDVVESRVGLTNRLVIPRYSAWPFYKELEWDIEIQNSKLINSLIQYTYIADFMYYLDVKDHTPKTWFRLEDVPKDENMSFVVKGRTKSKKEDWNTKMFAKGYSKAADIACELFKDGLIHNQGVIIREFVPLKVLEVGINDLPFSNEWRFFYYKKTRLTYFYYWKIAEHGGTINQEGLDFADMIADKIAENTNFFVIDIAEKADGGWIMIEANCGTSSGLGEEHCDEMYGNLRKCLDNN